MGIEDRVTGSLRISGGHAILDADCLDAASGRILWTRQFVGKIGDFMQADSQPVAEIVRAIGRPSPVMRGTMPRAAAYQLSPITSC